MKPKKVIDKFYFKDKGEPLFKALKPIKLPQHPDIIERIYNRYPYLNKMEITIIVLTAFEVLRDLLLQGCTIILRPFMPDFRLYVFQHIRKGKKYSAVKVKTGTPLTWKDRPSWKKMKK